MSASPSEPQTGLRNSQHLQCGWEFLGLLGGAVLGHGFPTDISRLQGDP